MIGRPRNGRPRNTAPFSKKKVTSQASLSKQDTVTCSNTDTEPQQQQNIASRLWSMVEKDVAEIGAEHQTESDENGSTESVLESTTSGSGALQLSTRDHSVFMIKG